MTIKNKIRPSIYRSFNRYTSSSSSNYTSNPAHEPSIIRPEDTFNKSPTFQEMKENEAFMKQFSSEKGHGKEFVDRNSKGFPGGLKEKGERIPEEQDRPEDYM